MDYCYYKKPDYCDTRNLHIIGVISMFLASKILDYMPIDLDFVFREVVHKEFSKKEICEYEYMVLEILEMDLTMPTWMDFLDKYIFDIFGYYRNNTSIFHFRQQCLHVLHIIAMDPTFYNCGGMK